MINGDAGDACTVVLGYSISFAPLAIPLGIILVAFLAKRWGTLERGTPRKEFRTSLAVVIVLAGLTAGFMAEGVADYVQANGWKFQFQASFGLKGVGPSIVVVPEVADRSLLAHLRLWSGSANWSYVETPYGPGLYVVVREDLTILYADFLIYPPPAQLPDTSFTMTGSW
ncbi:MAG TPA: hypothetical protein VEY12_03800, partial [Thermoplasmata archaeon]|nr:hypothetical protein [Thermoplasmata archaeon]